MGKNLIMPKLGAEMTAGRIVAWKKQEGEWVDAGEIVVVVETDKITYEVESPQSGYLQIIRQVEEEAGVSDPIGIFHETREEYEASSKPESNSFPKPPKPDPAAEPVPAVPQVPTKTSDGRTRSEIRISPLARKLAMEAGMDMGALQGTGPGGRIKKRDVLRFMESSQRPAADSAGEAVPSTAPGISPGPWVQTAKSIKEKIPLRGMRKVIAERLYRSIQQMAQFTDMGEIDVTETVQFRQTLLKKEDVLGIRISYNAILLKITALILREMPIFNASLIDEEIHIWNEIHMGMAVAVEDGLIVPVIRDTDKKTIVQIQHELNTLIDKAKNHRLTPDEIGGGTFTVSNFGSYGTFYGTPIINPPEVALLGLGVIREVPMIVHGEIKPGWTMNYSLTMDHRVIDGAKGGQFMQRLRTMLAHPALLGVMW